MADQLQLPLTPIIPPATQAAIEAALIGHGFRYEVIHEADEWFTTVEIRGARGYRRLCLVTYDIKPRIVLLVDEGTEATPEAEAETALLLVWLNGKFNVPAFLMSPYDRRIELKLALSGDLGMELSAEAVSGLLWLASWADKRTFPLIRKVAEGKSTAREAFAEYKAALEQG